MRVPLEWLSRYCDPGWSPGEVAERLSMSGTEVERVVDAATIPDQGFVVGGVESVEEHPDADRLRICLVDVGGSKSKIVCGAPNVAAGQSVAVALPGAVLPDGTKLKKAKLRGVESEGMILSEAELEVGEDDSGILVLTGDHLPGTPLSEAIPPSNASLELEITTNRPDCLSIYGVARELHAVSGAGLEAPPWGRDVKAGKGTRASDLASVDVECPEFCPRFTARVFSGVEVGPSPDWLARDLIAAGQRPINNVVDITNWVMLLTGQPLHAFDLDRLDGRSLTVRLSRSGDEVTTLDGEARQLPAGVVTIADAGAPVSIAGVMGGASSEVGEETSTILLESACWDGPAILRASRDLSLRSEASARFEKGLHPELAIRAQRVAAQLLVEICEATLAPGTIDIGDSDLGPRQVELRVAKVGELIGMEIDSATCVERLGRLGFGVRKRNRGAVLRCEVPPERDGDVRREVDLIEEVARLGDLDSALPATLPSVGSGRVGGLTRSQRLQRLVEDVLRDLGGHEIVSWSFHGNQATDLLRIGDSDPLAEPVRISNPLSEDQAAMRTGLVHGLLTSARLNLAHGAGRVFLFESGRVYLPGGANLESGDGPLAGRFDGNRPAPDLEPHHLGAVLSGGATQTWRDPLAAPDFFQVKALVEAVAGALGCEVEFSALEAGWLRPGRGARILTNAGESGWVGEIDPRVCDNYDLPAATAGFEVSLGSLVASNAAGEEIFSAYPLQPPVYEDFAFVVDESTGSDVVISAIRRAGGDLVDQVNLFDLYRSDELEPGSKSLAIRVTFRAHGKTLSEGEIAEVRKAVIEAVSEIGGQSRE